MRKAGTIITLMGLIILLTLSISYSKGMGKKSREDKSDTAVQTEKVKKENNKEIDVRKIIENANELYKNGIKKEKIFSMIKSNDVNERISGYHIYFRCLKDTESFSKVCLDAVSDTYYIPKIWAYYSVIGINNRKLKEKVKLKISKEDKFDTDNFFNVLKTIDYVLENKDNRLWMDESLYMAASGKKYLPYILNLQLIDDTISISVKIRLIDEFASAIEYSKKNNPLEISIKLNENEMQEFINYLINNIEDKKLETIYKFKLISSLKSLENVDKRVFKKYINRLTNILEKHRKEKPYSEGSFEKRLKELINNAK